MAMKTRILLRLAVPLAFLAGGCDIELDTRPGVLSVRNFGDAGNGLEYRAWVLSEGEYHWFLSFSGGDDAELEVNVPFPDEEQPASVVISLDPVSLDDDAPRSSLIAGRLDTFSTTSENYLQLSDELGLGTDFTQASAAFVLDTPTTDDPDDNGFGVWFHDPSGTEPALNLPQLPQGWIYEGWVETAAGRFSTGRFNTTGTDSDGPGLTAGESPGWNAPGQDFIEPPLPLAGETIAITVEPDPGDDPAAFDLEPFVLKEINNPTPPELTWMFKTDSLRHPSATLEVRDE